MVVELPKKLDFQIDHTFQGWRIVTGLPALLQKSNLVGNSTTKWGQLDVRMDFWNLVDRLANFAKSKILALTTPSQGATSARQAQMFNSLGNSTR